MGVLIATCLLLASCQRHNVDHPVATPAPRPTVKPAPSGLTYTFGKIKYVVPAGWHRLPYRCPAVAPGALLMPMSARTRCPEDTATDEHILVQSRPMSRRFPPGRHVDLVGGFQAGVQVEPERFAHVLYVVLMAGDAQTEILIDVRAVHRDVATTFLSDVSPA